MWQMYQKHTAIFVLFLQHLAVYSFLYNWSILDMALVSHYWWLITRPISSFCSVDFPQYLTTICIYIVKYTIGLVFCIGWYKISMRILYYFMFRCTPSAPILFCFFKKTSLYPNVELVLSGSRDTNRLHSGGLWNSCTYRPGEGTASFHVLSLKCVEFVISIYGKAKVWLHTNLF